MDSPRGPTSVEPITAALARAEGELEVLRCRAAALLVDELASAIDDAGPALREVRQQRLAIEGRVQDLREALAAKERRAKCAS